MAIVPAAADEDRPTVLRYADSVVQRPSRAMIVSARPSARYVRGAVLTSARVRDRHPLDPPDALPETSMRGVNPGLNRGCPVAISGSPHRRRCPARQLRADQRGARQAR
jgi:hypothetical protein